MTEDKTKEAAVETEAKEDPATPEATQDKGAEDVSSEASAKEEATPAEEKVEEVKEETVEEPKEVPAEYKEMIEKIENMTVLELNGLVKAIEERFGVSATAVAAAGGAGDAGAGAEEKDAFDVTLTSFGDKKIAVIKVVKEILGLGLKEAKDLVEGAPTSLKSEVKADEANEWKTKLEEAGATVELK